MLGENDTKTVTFGFCLALEVGGIESLFSLNECACVVVIDDIGFIASYLRCKRAALCLTGG